MCQGPRMYVWASRAGYRKKEEPLTLEAASHQPEQLREDRGPICGLVSVSECTTLLPSPVSLGHL